MDTGMGVDMEDIWEVELKDLEDYIGFGENRRDGVSVTIRFLFWETWVYFATVLR